MGNKSLKSTSLVVKKALRLRKVEEHERFFFPSHSSSMPTSAENYLLFFPASYIHVVPQYVLAKNDLEQGFHCLHYPTPPPLPY